MGNFVGLAKMGVLMNSPYLGAWPTKIGQYMLNFGAIELISYQYLDKLEATRADFNKNLDLLLGPRIGRVLQLIKDSPTVSNQDKVEITKLWEEAKELSLWRNRIAHNPVLPSWKPGSDSEHNPPDVLGVPDMKQLKFSDKSDSISLEGMGKLIDASADLAQRLLAAYAKLQGGV